MKKVLLSILFAGVSTFTFAQKSEINEAKKTVGLFQLVNKPNTELDKKLQTLYDGIKHTDNATTNEKSKTIAEAWTYRSVLTSIVALIDTVNLQNAEKYLTLAEEASAKAKELDTKGTEKDNLKEADLNIENAIRNLGILYYNKNDFKSAYRNFVKATDKNPKDTSMYLNAGIAARTIDQYPDMIKQFKKVISLNSPQSKDLYFEIINTTLSKLKDTAAAMIDIKEAAAKFPEVGEFVKLETQIYLDRGDSQKSEELVNKLTEKEPNNAIYQRLLGNIYFSRAFSIQKQRDKLDRVKKAKEFAALNSQVTVLLDKALPYYKKAIELDPKDVETLESLKQIYGFKGDTKNFDAYKKMRDAIQK